jgi:hypothetical protein
MREHAEAAGEQLEFVAECVEMRCSLEHPEHSWRLEAVAELPASNTFPGTRHCCRARTLRSMAPPLVGLHEV